MMALAVYNDLTRTKEKFIPLEEGKVRFYVCGPTGYNFFHIGNARPFVLFDVFRRYLESLNAYARSMVQPAPAPEVDSIRGIPPRVAIELRT